MPIVVDLSVPGSGLELSAVWLNDAADPSDYRSFEYTGESLQATTMARVDVRQLLGRRRLVRIGAGEFSESQSLTLVRCDRTEVAWLRAHTGVLMCFRDHVGMKFFGVYKDLSRDVATAYRDRIDVKITIESITHTEEA